MVRDIGIRIGIVLAISYIVFVSLFVRMYHLQITRHDELLGKAKKKYTTVATSKGERGRIFDVEGNLLVGNEPCSDINLDPSLICEDIECRRIARFFSKNLDVPFDTLYKRFSRKTRERKLEDGTKKIIIIKYAVIKKNVSFDKAEKLKIQCAELNMKGISFRDTSKRCYPKGQLLSNVLGFTNIEQDKQKGVMGLEIYCTKKIKGTDQSCTYERSRDGTALADVWNRWEKGKNGEDIILTVSEPIQGIMEEELDKLMDKWNPKAAYAVMADPFTGNILAIAQRPTYNPNDRSTMSAGAWRNRISEDIYEPGSTMKPIAIAGALDSGLVTPGQKFYCEKGYWIYANHPLRDCHAMGYLTVSEIIQKSSNIGTAKIALAMGEKGLYQTLKRFGFGSKTGMPLLYETKGLFKSLDKWDALSITRFPMGQGIAVSPLQMVRAYCALANGGYLPELRLIDRIRNSEGVETKYKPKPPTRVFRKKSTHRRIVEMMKLVTQEGGTALQAAVDGYYVAGKTGTSQKVINGRYSHSKYFASFIGFIPADAPRFVLLIVADEPQKSHYGGVVTAPTFREISKRTLKYLNVPPTYYYNTANNK